MSSKNTLTNARGFVAARLETRVGHEAVSRGNVFAVAFSRAVKGK